MRDSKKGKVYIVGAGAGEPGLITVKGKEILSRADTVLYDYLVNPEILGWARDEARLVCAKELGKGKSRQRKISEFLVNRAEKGENVVRLKNGDPSVFSRLKEEMEYLLKNRVEYRVVPGVTAATSAGCKLGIPLTSRGISASVKIITGHEASGKTSGFTSLKEKDNPETIATYMGVKNLGKVTKKLVIEGGKSPNTPAVLISKIGTVNQKIVRGNLANILRKSKQKNISPPAILIAGEVAGITQKSWFERIDKVLYTGLSDRRYFEDGIIFHIPMIRIIPLEEEEYLSLDAYISEIEKFDWIIFTSRYGVKYFLKRLYNTGFDSRILKNIKIAAIGNSTSGRLLKYGIKPDLKPDRESSNGLVEKFKERDLTDKKILLPRSDISDKGIEDRLKEQGADTYSANAYRNVMPKRLPDLDLKFFDRIIFSSPSTVRNFIKRYGEVPEGIEIDTIGPVTEKECKKWNITN